MLCWVLCPVVHDTSAVPLNRRPLWEPTPRTVPIFIEYLHRLPVTFATLVNQFQRLFRDWASAIMKTEITWLDAKHIPSLESIKESGERALQSLMKSEKLAEIKTFLASDAVKPLHRVSLILAFLPVVAVSQTYSFECSLHRVARRQKSR